jgi:tyrosinase
VSAEHLLPVVQHGKLTRLVSYWDWSLDVANVSASSIWDAKSAFGGNGVAPRPTDTSTDERRPFKDFTVEYSQLATEKHCIGRNWNSGGEEVGSMWAESYTPAIVAAGQEHVYFTSYSVTLENGPHGAIHAAVGGDMSPSTSPIGKSTTPEYNLTCANVSLDPIFFLHHGHIDRLWTL